MILLLALLILALVLHRTHRRVRRERGAHALWAHVQAQSTAYADPSGSVGHAGRLRRGAG